MGHMSVFHFGTRKFCVCGGANVHNTKEFVTLTYLQTCDPNGQNALMGFSIINLADIACLPYSRDRDIASSMIYPILYLAPMRSLKFSLVTNHQLTE